MEVRAGLGDMAMLDDIAPDGAAPFNFRSLSSSAEEDPLPARVPHVPFDGVEVTVAGISRRGGCASGGDAFVLVTVFALAALGQLLRSAPLIGSAVDMCPPPSTTLCGPCEPDLCVPGVPGPGDSWVAVLRYPFVRLLVFPVSPEDESAVTASACGAFGRVAVVGGTFMSPCGEASSGAALGTSSLGDCCVVADESRSSALENTSW